MAEPTLLWHDYETSGADRARDRPWQFAAQRTTLDLVPIGDPIVLHCKPATDVLPHPVAVAITGLTPQQMEAEGLTEVEFARLIQKEMSVPNTCSVGFNSIRFDDEVTRYMFYRNFIEPYDREWRNDNSRWDLIDVARLCHALRPDGITWPKREDGRTSFRLEDLATANGLQQGTAHNALADVRTTIALARLLREKQPKLYEFAFEHRRKQAVGKIINPADPKPFVHVASYYPADDGCLTVLVPVMPDTTNANQIWCWDLRRDPAELVGMTDEQMAARLYERAAEREDDMEPFGLRSVTINKSPAVAPTSVLGGLDLGRFRLDLNLSKERVDALRTMADLKERLARALALRPRPVDPNIDPDIALYEGFPTAHDNQLFRQVHKTNPYDLGRHSFPFDQKRNAELLFRFRGRNHPDTLNEAERTRWQDHCRARLVDGTPGVNLTEEGFHAELAQVRATPLGENRLPALLELERWVREKMATLQPAPAAGSPPRL